jgi:hypothetical protein
MTVGNLARRVGQNVAAAAIVALVGMMATPQPAHAISDGAAVGLGVGAFALGSALAARPYYGGYGYYGYPGYYYAPPPAYYAPPPVYYRPRSCWDPYYGRYYAC